VRVTRGEAEFGEQNKKRGNRDMNTVKKVTGWILPVVLVGTLLFTMNTLKRTDTLTPDEQKKIEQHQNGQA